MGEMMGRKSSVLYIFKIIPCSDAHFPFNKGKSANPLTSIYSTSNVAINRPLLQLMFSFLEGGNYQLLLILTCL